jgi:hypothetical protein
MQYTLHAGDSPDLAAIEQAIATLDPAALLDLDGRVRAVRISTVATERELVDCLQQAGIAVAADQLLRLPSECCGGCGG